MAGTSPAMTLWGRPQAPGRSRMRLATMPSITSTGAALDRVGLRAQPGAPTGAAPWSARFPIPARRCRRPMTIEDLVAALVELGAVIFHRRGEARMPLARPWRDPPCARPPPPAQPRPPRTSAIWPRGAGIFQPALARPLPIEIRGDLAERPAHAALTHAQEDHRALVLQQIFRRRPSRD